MPPRRQRLGIDTRPLQQRRQRQPAVGAWTWAAFQLGQRQQVAHQRLHAVGLLTHQRQHTFAFDLGQRQLRQRLDKASHHRQRRADLVRDVGHKVAPHRVGAFVLGDVLRQHQLHALAIGPHQHRQGVATRRPREDDGLVEQTRLQIGHEGRSPHEVGHALAAVARRVQAEVLRTHRVAPVDLPGSVQQHHAVGRCFDGGEELLQALPLLAQRQILVAQGPFDAIGQLAPETGVPRRGWQLRAAQPAQQPMGAPGVAQHHGRQPNQTADGATQARVTQHGTGQPAKQGADDQRRNGRRDAQQGSAHRLFRPFKPPRRRAAASTGSRHHAPSR